MKKAMLTLSLICGMTVGMAGGPAWALVPRPLTEFTVFGLHGVVIGVGSTVKESAQGKNDGNVGSCGAAPCVDPNVSPGFALSMNGGSKIEGNAFILGNSRVQGSIAGALTTLGSVVGNVPSVVVQDPDVADDPTIPAVRNTFLATVGLPDPLIAFLCPTGQPGISGGNGQTIDLVPGAYGPITVGAALTLNLQKAGIYLIDSIKTGHGATINVQEPGTRVIVCGAANFASARVTPANLEHTDFTTVVLSTDPENAFSALGGTQWRGDVLAVRGGIHIGSGGSQSSVFGRLLAGEVVDIEHGVVVQATGQTCCDHGTPKDATLLHSAKNLNNGANNILLVKNQVAAIVGFDVAGLNGANVTSAKLVLTVCNMPNNQDFCPQAALNSPVVDNFTPNTWPAAGAHITAFRLEDGFEDWGSGIPGTNTPPEGNGNNFPANNNPHGSDAGVTWNCSIDSNIANEARDCSPALFWNGGLTHQGPGTDSDPVITNGLADGTKITFDVTADVQAGLGPLDTTFMTWFVRRLSDTGIVSFYSLQGAQLLGNLNLAPQLIIQ
jgi:hypothetical protein